MRAEEKGHRRCRGGNGGEETGVANHESYQDCVGLREDEARSMGDRHPKRRGMGRRKLRHAKVVKGKTTRREGDDGTEGGGRRL